MASRFERGLLSASIQIIDRDDDSARGRLWRGDAHVLILHGEAPSGGGGANIIESERQWADPSRPVRLDGHVDPTRWKMGDRGRGRFDCAATSLSRCERFAVLIAC